MSERDMQIVAAIALIEETNYDCGEWNEDTHDEPYNVYFNRAQNARAHLLNLLNLRNSMDTQRRPIA